MSAPRRGRRKNGEGTWEKRERTLASGVVMRDWIYKVSLGIDVTTGKRMRRKFYGRTQAEARLKFERARDQGGGSVVPADGLTVEAYLLAWLADVERARTGPTARFYEGRIRRFALPAIGRMRLADLRNADVEKLYRSLDRAGVSADNVQKLHRGLRRAFNVAIGKGLLRGANPCSFVERRAHRSTKRIALDAAQVAIFFTAIAGHPLEAMFRLGVLAAMRPGELYALAWPDVDLARGVVDVHRSLEEDPPRKLVPAKANSARKIPIEPETVRALEALAMVPRGAGKGPFAFVTPRGTWIAPKTANAALRDVCATAKLPALTLYNLRHTGVSLFGEAGVSIRVISDLAGHADTQITTDVYAHATGAMHRDAVDRAAALVRASKAA